VATPEGAALLDSFVKLHDQEAPAAMAELRGNKFSKVRM
jgi:hypothetical protein